MKIRVTLASLFDGIGGAPLCATLCGAVPLWSSEIEPIPISITKRHFPDMKHYGDITKINGAEVEPVDIIVGGSPCQDLSVAGKRAGLDGARSGLFMEQIRIVKEMRDATKLRAKRRSDTEVGFGSNANDSIIKTGVCSNYESDGIKPRFMVWENVPGAFSSNNGEDFRIVLEETARVADPTIRIPRCEAWSNAGSILGDGFSISWRVIDAQYWGVPQRRRRIYLVADFRGQSAPEICFERDGLSGHFAASGAQGQGTAGNAKGGVTTAGGSDVTSTLFAAYGTKWNGNSGALTGDHFVLDDACRNNDKGKESRSKGQGTAGDAERCVGNAICFEPRSQDGVPRISSDGLSPTLNTAQGGQRQPCVVTAISQLKHARRLTPIECERLQGYPDNWTALTHDGKPVSDSARYKALGNSFAIPCALYVIQGCVDILRDELGVTE